MSDPGPPLHLDWEERIVGWLFRKWRTLRDRGEAQAARPLAHFSDLETRLRLLTQLFAGGPLRVRVAESNGGVHGRLVLLPAVMGASTTIESNTELYVLRAAIEGTRVARGPGASTGDWLSDEVRCIQEAAQAVAWLIENFDGFSARLRTAQKTILERDYRHDALHQLRLSAAEGRFDSDPQTVVSRLRQLPEAPDKEPGFPLWGGSLSPPDVALAEEMAKEDEALNARSIATEIEAPAKDHVERVTLPTDDDADVMPIHTFEKVECLDSFNGNRARTDGSDELEDHLEALEEVDLRHVVRGGEAPESVFRADIEGLGGIPDVHHLAPGERGIPYDEWHQAERAYRRSWTTVYPSTVPSGDQAWATERLQSLAGLKRALLKRLSQQRHARKLLPRQRDGDEVDLAALIESYGDRRAGQVGDNRLFIQNPRTDRQTATTVLIDISLSSDAWVEDKRVLDTCRDAVLLFGEVAGVLGDQFEVLAFASHTRNHCRVFSVKGWKENWREGKGRLGQLRPTGYTRIGPALRHATQSLDRTTAERKLLLLITDGKPNDYDHYEGSHGIADVRQATREAARLGVHVHAIGIQPTAAQGLALMFGHRGSQTLRHINHLPEAFVEAFGRLT